LQAFYLQDADPLKEEEIDMSKRTPWCNKETVVSKREILRAQARLLISKTAERTVRDIINEPTGYQVVRGVDLRAPLEEKASECCEFTKWTAFINKAGTLIHVLPKAGDFHVRIPMFYSTNGLSVLRLEAMLASHLEGRLV
jgi:hypothetical protein